MKTNSKEPSKRLTAIPRIDLKPSGFGLGSCRGVNQVDLMLMPSTLERRLQPNLHDIQCRLDIHHALAKRNDIRVVMLPAKPRRLRIPTKSAANAFDPVGHNRLAVARAAQNDAALKFMSRHRLSHRPDKKRIIHRLFGVRTEIGDAMPALRKKISNLFFVNKPRVVRTNCYFHACLPPKHATPNSTAPVPTSPTLT